MNVGWYLLLIVWLLLPLFGIIFGRALRNKYRQESFKSKSLIWISSIAIFAVLVTKLHLINLRGLSVILFIMILVLSLWNIWNIRKIIPLNYKSKNKDTKTLRNNMATAKLFSGLCMFVVGIIGFIIRNTITSRLISQKKILKEIFYGGESFQNVLLIIIFISTILMIIGLYFILSCLINNIKRKSV